MYLLANFPLTCALIAILFTQVIKYPIAVLRKGKRTSLSIITTTGGMPSSHSAAVSALITALILEYGYNSGYVAVAATFGVIVMFDSMGVRRQSGEHGIVLAELLKHLDSLPQAKHEDHEPGKLRLSHSEHLVIKKYLGHKPIEVFVGLLTGILVVFIVRLLYAGFGLL